MGSSISRPQFGSKNYYRQVSSGVHPPAMFATAKELVDKHSLGDLGSPVSREDEYGNEYHEYFDNKDDLLQHKLEDDDKLSYDIGEHGFDWSEHVNNPYYQIEVNAENKTLTDGHHRVAAMLAYRPDEFIPFSTYHMGEKSAVTPKDK